MKIQEIRSIDLMTCPESNNVSSVVRLMKTYFVSLKFVSCVSLSTTNHLDLPLPSPRKKETLLSFCETLKTSS